MASPARVDARYPDRLAHGHELGVDLCLVLGDRGLLGLNFLDHGEELLLLRICRFGGLHASDKGDCQTGESSDSVHSGV